jgi:ferrochelatase
MLGVLLVNLGTPEAPQTSAVRRYLAEFLADGRVLDIPTVPRMLLLYGAILPFRPKKSAHAYQQIWDAERGSPLLFHTQDLAARVQEALGDGASVQMAMRYGQPDLDQALDRFAADGIDRVVVLPLYPQYASSSTGSTLARVYELAAQRPVPPTLIPIRDFYDHPGFIDAQAEVARPRLDAFGPDHVLFSFHGVPERQVTATDFSGGKHCLQSADCCAAITNANRACYRAQCFATARALAKALDLGDGAWSVSFQSRLGRIPWIKPYTDEVLVEMAQQGTRRLAILTPSFVADCLETLEEIGIRAREDFRAAGGDELLAVPCVNSEPAWVRGVTDLVRGALTTPS